MTPIMWLIRSFRIEKHCRKGLQEVAGLAAHLKDLDCACASARTCPTFERKERSVLIGTSSNPKQDKKGCTDSRRNIPLT